MLIRPMIEPRYGVRVVKNTLIPMRDGVRLAADLFMPDEPGRWPAILEYIPYRKDDNTSPGHTQHHYYAQRGFVGVRVDIRGSGASGGVPEDEYCQNEQLDGVEVIAWLARQPWCNGRVGMTGTSYGGFTAIQIAMHQPPALKAIAPIYATDDRYTEDCHYCGGLLRAHNQWGRYGLSMVPSLAQPPYPEISGADWVDVWQTRLDYLSENGPWLWRWLGEQTDGSYWRHGSLSVDYDRVTCPTLLIGGWRDGYPNWPLRTFAKLKAPKKVIIGPYTHTSPMTGFPGPNINHFNEIARWFAHWLRDEDTGALAEPPVTVYMMAYQAPTAAPTSVAGNWRHATESTTSDAYTMVLFLGAGGALGPLPPPPGTDDFDEYSYNSTVGTTRGLWCWFLPTDQRPDEGYGPTYSTLPLTEPLAILGNPTVTLAVSSSAPVMAFVAVLCDVAPDGTSAMVCKGALNGTRRDSLTEPTPMSPETVYQIEFQLDATGWVFQPGHRLRLSICSADWPNLWPTPLPGKVQVYASAKRLSMLRLPFAPSTWATAPAFHPPMATPKTAETGGDFPEWRVESDQIRGLSRVTTRAHTVTKPIGYDIEVTAERTATATARADDPATVTIVGRNSTTIKRPEVVTQLEALGRVRSDAKHFHGQVSLEITLDGQRYWAKTWTRSFARNLL